MDSCDNDDFVLVGDEAQSHHRQQQAADVASFSVSTATIPIHPHPLNSITSSHAKVDDDEDPEDCGESFTPNDKVSNKCCPTLTFHNQCFATGDPAADGDGDGDNNPKQPKDRDELSDDGGSGSPYCFDSGGKRSRPLSSWGDYRKDREEWSDSAIGCLLDTYTDKYVQLNRGNLRGMDWEDVATVVTQRCDKHKSCKSVEQCKNKVDSLKKRYKAECLRLTSGSLSVSHWPWFNKMEQLLGSSSKSIPDQDDKGVILVAGSTPIMRRTKRYPAVASGPVSLMNNLKVKPLSNPRWRRVVLKISGAALAGNGPQNVDPKTTMLIAREIAVANRLGVEVAIVVGGRNFFCRETWVAATGTDRATAYQIGMMATVMNSILLQASLEKIGVQARVQTTFMMQAIAEPYIRRRAIRHLEKGRVVIFGGIDAGIGNPLFTTDTAAAVRASEINADAVLKGTNVNDVYDCHSKNSFTVTFEHISFRELVSRGCFSAMDFSAITFCEENSISVVVFNLLEPGNISRALCGDRVGTLIDQSGSIS